MRNALISLYIGLMTILLPINSIAQLQDSYIPKLSIGLSPSAMFNVYSGLQASLDIRVTDKWNSASEFTYIFGLLNTPGFRIKSGLHYQVANYKTISLNFGPNVLYQRVKTGRAINLLLQVYGYESDIYYNQNRVAGEVMFSVRKYFTPRFFMEFGVAAGAYSSHNIVTPKSEDNLKTLLAELNESHSYENISETTEVGLLPSFNLNLSYVLAQ